MNYSNTDVLVGIVVVLTISFVAIPIVSAILAVVASRIKVKRFDRRIFQNHFLWLVILFEALWFSYLMFNGWALTAACFVILVTSTIINRKTEFLKAEPNSPLRPSTVTVVYSYNTDDVVSDTFTGGGPYKLSRTPNGDLLLVFFDGYLQPLSNVDITSSTENPCAVSVSLASGVDSSLFRRQQSYQEESEPEPYVCG